MAGWGTVLPDMEGRVTTYLTGVLTPVSVGGVRDETPSVASQVVVIGTGGGGVVDQFMQSVQLTVDSYAATDGLAFALAARVDAALYEAVGRVRGVVRVAGTTPANMPHPDYSGSRYSATYQFSVKRERKQ